MGRFICFALCAALIIAFSSYKEIKRDYFYIDKANLVFASAENNDLLSQSSLIASTAKVVHSSTLVDTPSGLMALFFSGTREGAKDVAIYQSFYDELNNEWSKPQSILDAPTLSKMSHKFIKKLGNPVAFKDTQGKLHFFVVGVSLGGWATSKVYQLEFDENYKIKFKGELELGALANLSHLVRNPALILDNGGFILPLYHELARKYPLLAYFDEKGKLLYTQRINALKNQLQPSLIASDVSGTSCLVFLRNHKAYDDTAFLQECSARGKYWGINTASNLKNYDSSSVLSAVFVDDKKMDFLQYEILLIHNDGDKEKPRSKLSLFWLKDMAKGEFVKLFTLDEGEEVSYPAVLTKMDKIYITYTLDRKHIKMRMFSIKAIQKAIDENKEKQ